MYTFVVHWQVYEFSYCDKHTEIHESRAELRYEYL